ncbi:MAG: 50S ribosomal protein L6 [Bacteroidota bacterium]
MSRIGNLPINVPDNVKITVQDELVTVEGPLGTLAQKVDKDLIIEINDKELIVKRAGEEKRQKSMHGLYRSLINNMVVGVSQGYEKKLELVGVGYKAEANGQMLELALGYSHNFIFEMPQEIKVEAVTERRSNPVITLRSIDKQLIGHVAAKIRSLRKPEPYKGKGIKFVGEQLRRKAGKAAAGM